MESLARKQISTSEKDNKFDFFVELLGFAQIQQQQPTEYLDIPTARELITKEIGSNDNIICRITTGVGKTFAANQYIKQLLSNANNQIIIFAIPSNEVTDEIKKDLSKLGDFTIVRYESRNDNNCDFVEECRRIMSLDLKPFDYVCKKKCHRISGDNRCEYLSQLDDFENGVILCTHAAVKFVIDKLDNKNIRAGLVICDESPTFTGGIIDCKSLNIDSSMLLKLGLAKSDWWTKTKHYLNQISLEIKRRNALSQWNYTFYARIPLGLDKEYLDELSGEEGWRGYKAYIRELDNKSHHIKCEEERLRIESKNKEIRKSNTKILEQWKRDKKAFVEQQHKEKNQKMLNKVLSNQEVSIDIFPAIEPQPEIEYREPARRTVSLDRQTWERGWEGKTFAAGDGRGFRLAGITSADIAMARELLASQESYYKDGYGTEHNEWGFFRKMLYGEKNGSAYAQITVERTTNPKTKEVKITPKIEFKISSRNDWDLRGTRLVILDGTGDQEELEATFKMPLRLVNADIAPVDSKTVHFELGLGKMKAKTIVLEENENYLKQLLKRAIKELTSDDKKILILTHKILQNNFNLPDIASRIDTTRKYEAMHYFEKRGTNQYEDHEAVIALGTPYMSPLEFEIRSIQLFGEVNHKWMARKGLEETIQSINRVRPIHNRRTVIVIGQYFPEESLGKPKKVINCRRKGSRAETIAQAAELLTPIALEKNFMTKALAEEFGVIDENCDLKQQEFEERTGNIPFLYQKRRWGDVIQAVAATTGLEMGGQAYANHKGRPSGWCGSRLAATAYLGDAAAVWTWTGGGE